MSADASELPPPGTQDLWLALTASQRGAAHRSTGLPNQDAVAARQVEPDVLIAAVADGHGHRRHFRSARGSQLAVAAAGQAAQDLAARLDGFHAAAPIESEVLGTLVPAITGGWRAAVREDLAADPFTTQEEASRGAGDDALIAYGSTLLLAIAGGRWLVLVQIGDGDIVGIRPDGRALNPVPRDPSLDGHQTTSLCGPYAEDDFRAAVVDTSATPLLGVMLATDGYGNAQVADPWTEAVSADLAELISDRPPQWLAGQVPLWASRCASADGSADDTTIALLIAPPATGGRHPAPGEPAAGEAAAGQASDAEASTDEATTGQATTAPARRLADLTTVPSGHPAVLPEQRLAKSLAPVPGDARTVPDGDPPGPARAPAARTRRLIVLAGTAVVVIAAVAVFLAIHLGSSPGPAPASPASPVSHATATSCTSPSAGATASTTASPTPGGPAQAGAAGNPCGGGKAGG